MAETNKPENPPAFPMSVYKAYGNNPGMALRDYFARGAMEGLLSNPNGISGVKHAANPDEFIAWKSYKLADEMLKARSK